MCGAVLKRYCGTGRLVAAAVGLAALTLLPGACGWLDSKRNAAEPQAAAPAAAAPDWDGVRAKMAPRLLADRENARYSNEPITRQAEETDAPAR